MKANDNPEKLSPLLRNDKHIICTCTYTHTHIYRERGRDLESEEGTLFSGVVRYKLGQQL